MAGFHTKTFQKHDDYMTPRHAWENIAHLIPKDKVIWEAFYGDGKSGTYLRELGFNTIHEDIDFFTEDRGDIIVSNPPFSRSKEVLTRLKELNKPFIMILPASKVTTQYMRALFKDTEDKLQLIIPRKRIHFQKQINGEIPEDYKSCCNFDCFYYCWKIGLPRDLLWLE
jgi:Adenine-specific methyltransferase EcoRI